MRELTPSQKGAAAEAEITAAAVRLRVPVLRPLVEGCRYDLAFDIGSQLLRVQCKWAVMRKGVISARAITSRHTPRGYVRSVYTAAEIDAIAAFSPDTELCYLIPVELAERRTSISLRVDPARNNQAIGVRWAREFELEPSLEANWGVDLDEAVIPQDFAAPRR